MIYCICVLQELVVALSHLVVQYESNFCTVALQFIEEEKNYTVPSPANTAGTVDKIFVWFVIVPKLSYIFLSKGLDSI